MKLVGCIFVGNEKLMVKYVMPYILDYGYDKLYLYDDSDDGTIDLIKAYNYPFIEIVDAHGKHDDGKLCGFEDFRLKIETEMFENLKKEAKETDEEIWFSFMDFDEVVFATRYINDRFKMYLWELSISQHVNYYAGKSAQLVSGYDTCEELDSMIGNQHFVHGMDGMNCISWSCWGTKVSAIMVNDIEKAYFDMGNHCFGCHMEEGISPINAYDFGNIFSFHLRFLTKEHYMYKCNVYSNRYNITLGSSEKDEADFYKKISTKFPVSLIFFDNFNKYAYQCKSMGGSNIGGLTVI